jgi:hypothetical protein
MSRRLSEYQSEIIHRSGRREGLDAVESHHRLDLLAEPLRNFIEHRAVRILGSYGFDVDERCR